MISASAPGKIILFGEHAVVYGRPALAVPVTQVQATAIVRPRSKPGILIDAPSIGLHSELSQLPSDHPLAAAITKTLSSSFLQNTGKERRDGLTIHIESTIPVASGLGSGAAVSVAVIRALSSFASLSLSDEQVNAIAYEVEKLHHGTPSGIDNTVITYAKPVYFVKGKMIETLCVGAPFTIVIADTGISAPTKESVGDVRKLWETDKRQWEPVFDEIGAIADQAREKIVGGKWEDLGPLMDRNHALLQNLTVSSPELDRLVEASRQAGALGAKLSGGGRGGNMIALVRPEQAEKVALVLRSAGASRTIITTIQRSKE
jgi:mevalonate kinase